jgi:hypothetical protein
VIIRPSIARIATMLSAVALVAALFPTAVGAAGGGISGTVTAANGTPAVGVLVLACAGTTCTGAQAGSDGTYAIAGLAAGSYVVSFTDALGSGVSGYYASSGFTSSKSAATPVVVGSSVVSGISARFPGAAGAASGGISGTVSAANGTPAVGVLVLACAGTVCSGAQAGSDGTYTISGLSAGNYIVSFTDALGSGVSGFYASSGFVSDKSAATPVVVGSSVVSGISARLTVNPSPPPGPSPSGITFKTGAALGNTRVGPFVSATRIQHAPGYITWKMDGGLAAAGQTIKIYVARKTSALGRWTPFTILTTRRANAAGVIYANIRTGGVLWLSIRPNLGSAWGPTSIGRWIR